MKILILALVAIGFSCVDEARLREGLEQEVATEADSQMEQGSNYTNIGDSDIYGIRLEDEEEVVAEILRTIQQENNDDIQMNRDLNLIRKTFSFFANFGAIAIFLYQTYDKYYHLLKYPWLLDFATDRQRNRYFILNLIGQSANVGMYLYLNEMNIQSPRIIWRFWHLVV